MTSLGVSFCFEKRGMFVLLWISKIQKKIFYFVANNYISDIKEEIVQTPFSFCTKVRFRNYDLSCPFKESLHICSSYNLKTHTK